MSEAIRSFGYRETSIFEAPEGDARAPSETTRPEPEPGPSPFARALSAIGDSVDRGEALVARAVGGKLGGLDAPALIAVQAGIYRYSEAVELAAKLVDRAGNSLRTVLTGSGH